MVPTNTFKTRRTRRKDLIRIRLASADPQVVIDALWEAANKLDDPPFVQEASVRVAASLDPRIRYNAVLVLLNAIKKPEKLDRQGIMTILARARIDTDEHVRGAAADLIASVRLYLGWQLPVERSDA